MFRAVINIVRPALAAALGTFPCLSNSLSQTYSPPQNSPSLTANLRSADPKPLDEDYRSQFVNCDGNGPPGLKDHFRGHSLVIPGRPQNKQYYLCSRDPSHLGALLRMPDGADLGRARWRSTLTDRGWRGADEAAPRSATYKLHMARGDGQSLASCAT